MNKKFRSTSGKVERLTLPEGGVALVDITWGGLPPQFHKEAYVHGCESEDMVLSQGEKEVSTTEQNFIKNVVSKKVRIKEAIHKILADNNVDDFTYYKNTSEWKPKTTKITSIIGIRIMNSERDMIWYKMLEDEEMSPREFK